MFWVFTLFKNDLQSTVSVFILLFWNSTYILLFISNHKTFYSSYCFRFFNNSHWTTLSSKTHISTTFQTLHAIRIEFQFTVLRLHIPKPTNQHTKSAIFTYEMPPTDCNSTLTKYFSSSNKKHKHSRCS